ncbi:glycosyltransferase family 2 protein [Myroides sp. 1354]|uniref:glycosyltransferase family 2 protein n=1 Tax=unclassified Myroides TaxID=2642485 RepID=UPI002578D4A5|nr:MULTISPECIES: glycosyltransferase family 2 protein [unclassified Myroides]MDM1044441.1 glycosyltransferase family 2 protein [Myroides sp. R163-1]MDM1056315.1 glycosyltransferase family 2 protein [Myroides sp. 1354]MDM1069329.1 glycosyltransferase family 2 protein [Myroides sp. 1372]
MMVSIITPVYNAERFLRETAESVINQTYQDWEWVLVNDCSTDDSWNIMQELADRDNRIKIFTNSENLKSGKTRNFAIQQAIGRYIAFLDADDKWHVDKLAIQIPFMMQNDYYFSHTSYGYLDELGNKIKSTLHVSKEVDYQHLLKRTEISCLTAVYDAEKIGKFYMSEHARKQDYALWLSILKSGVKSYGIDKELAYYRQVKNSATSSKHKLILKHIDFLKDTQGFGTIKAMYYTGYWMINGFIRYFIK